MHSFAPFSNVNFFVKNRHFVFCDWINEYSLIQSQTLRILHFFSEFLMNFFPDFAPNSRKEWGLSLFNQFCENELENYRNFWKFWKLFNFIQFYSIVSLLSTHGSPGNFTGRYVECTEEIPVLAVVQTGWICGHLSLATQLCTQHSRLKGHGQTDLLALLETSAIVQHDDARRR